MTYPDEVLKMPRANKINILNQAIQPVVENNSYAPLLALIGEAEVVLIGEATHGTDEFYASRAAISKRLIMEKGFTTIAIEGDWPDVYQLHRYIQGHTDSSADEALKVFKRFPTWMWSNEVIRDFILWLREYNEALLPHEIPISFYGLDLYSLHSSIEVVIHYLDKVDPQAAKIARERYDCFDSGYFNPKRYGYATAFKLQNSCQEAVVKQLIDLQQHAYDYLQQDGLTAQSDYFNALQNARLIRNAEAYYRSQLEGNISSWNLRDNHMFETLLAIKTYKEQQHQQPAKMIVWAHNSHIGNASATEMHKYGELNIGQLAKEHFGIHAINIGYSTYTGRVTAASYWGGKADYKAVQPALMGSYENLFHQLKHPDFLLLLKDKPEVSCCFSNGYLERAIGIIYRPETERQSHYFYANLSQQFDALLHFDRTQAIKPLTSISEMPKDELPETYPSGI